MAGGAYDWWDPRSFPERTDVSPELLREAHQEQSRVEKRRARIRSVRNLAAGQLARKIEQALDGGATRTGRNTFTWDVSRGCRLPYSIVSRSSGMAGSVEMVTACRTNCEVCLDHRRRLWTARAICEAQSASRTWQATLTARPEALYAALCDANSRGLTSRLLPVRHSIEVPDDRDPEQTQRVRTHEVGSLPQDEFNGKVQVLGEEVTTWLKRVRKRCTLEWALHGIPSGAGALRYLLVVERHQSGEPHFHLLMHETSALTPMRNDWLCKPPRSDGPQVDARWKLGFSNFKLKEVKDASYVAKYLSKSLLARVRASKRYGVRTASADPERELDHKQSF